MEAGTEQRGKAVVVRGIDRRGNQSTSNNERQTERTTKMTIGDDAMKQTDEEWLNGLKKNPVYSGINIDRELGKMQVWLSLRPGRKMTRRFIVNWLNKIDAPIQSIEPFLHHRNNILSSYLQTSL